MAIEISFFIILGPLFLAISQLRDVYYFMLQLYTSKIDKLSTYKRPNMNMKGLLLLHELTREKIRKVIADDVNGRSVRMINLVNELRDKL